MGSWGSELKIPDQSCGRDPPLAFIMVGTAFPRSPSHRAALLMSQPPPQPSPSAPVPGRPRPTARGSVTTHPLMADHGAPKGARPDERLIEDLQASFREMSPRSGSLAIAFYELLFTKNPGLRGMFPED